MQSQGRDIQGWPMWKLSSSLFPVPYGCHRHLRIASGYKRQAERNEIQGKQRCEGAATKLRCQSLGQRRHCTVEQQELLEVKTRCSEKSSAHYCVSLLCLFMLPAPATAGSTHQVPRLTPPSLDTHCVCHYHPFHGFSQIPSHWQCSQQLYIKNLSTPFLVSFSHNTFYICHIS